MSINFEDLGLSGRIIKLIREKGFKYLTEPQLKAIPYILEGKNVLIMAPTGSGKTEAAIIPILDMMSNIDGSGIKLIYITPLRALNRDLIDRINWWATKLGYRISIRHGDTPKRERRIQTLSPPDILITTPETFSHLLNTKVFSKHLVSVRWIIIDEIHELVDNKRGAQLSINIERLNELTGRLQRIGLSATIGSPEKVLKFLVGVDGDGVIVDTDISKRMEIDVLYPRPETIDYHIANKLYTYPPVASRIREIYRLVKSHKSTLIFTNTRPMAEILGSRITLYEDGLPVSVHHGSLSRDMRVRLERHLKTGLLKGLICTSSLELGIDIGDIDLVIQYNSPRQVSRLIQRVGRSGHWIGRTSRGVIIVQDLDDYLEALVIRDMALKMDLEPARIILKPYDVLIHELVGILIKEGEITLQELYSLLKRSYIYKDLELRELGSLIEFTSSLTRKYIHYDKDRGVIIRPRGSQDIFNYYYSTLSMIPEVKQYLVIDDEDNTPIGVLDEEFVATYGEIGVKFIIGGMPWRIIQIYRDKVYVKPEEDYYGAIPDWIGEEIPVPLEVAMEVGRRKRIIEDIYKKVNGDHHRFIEEARDDLGILDINTLEVFYKQLSSDIPLPTDKRILIEKFSDKIVVNIHGGTMINRTLANYIATTLQSEYGEIVYYSSDPYRLFIQSRGLNPRIVIEILMNIDRYRDHLSNAITNSRVFLWRLIHVARRMGILTIEKSVELKDAEMLSTVLRDTPVYYEAYRETSFKDFDLDGALKMLEWISRGDIEVYLVEDEGPTPLTRHYINLYEIRFERPRVERIQALKLLSMKAKLLNEVRTFICLDCLSEIWESRIRDLDDEIKCMKCSSRRIGLTSLLPEEVYRLAYIARGNPRRLEKDRVWREIIRSGSLIEKYGKVAAFILANQNLKIGQVEEILKLEDRLSGRLIQLIIEYERRNLLGKFHHPYRK